MKDPKKKLFGLILNGGLSRRMGSDKSKKMVSNKPLISLVVEKAKAQVDYLAINSNQKSSGNKIEIIPDCLSGNLGPLVGVLSGLKWLEKNDDSFCNWLVIFPVDSPFFPENLVQCFFENLKRSFNLAIRPSSFITSHITELGFNLDSFEISTEASV